MILNNDILIETTENQRFNRYDYYIIALIASLMFGGYGGFLTLPRVVALILSPYGITKLSNERNRLENAFLIFFFIWYSYGVVSLIWTSNISEAFKELFYYLVHFLMFFEIIIFFRYANHGVKSILIGWIIALIGTEFVGVWELVTDKHLSIARHGSNYIKNNGKSVILFRHASATFYNYNGYVTFICFSLPFLLYSIYSTNKRIWKYVCILALLVATIILFYNTSRGGLLCLGLDFLIFALYSLRGRKSFFTFAVLFLIVIIVFINYGDKVLSNFLFRMQSTSLVDGSNRYGVWAAILELFVETMGFGVGLGGLSASLSTTNSRIQAAHNVFLELLLQFGIIITLIVVGYLACAFIKAIQQKNKKIQIIQLLTIASFPIVGIINSNLLLEPQLWLFFASLIVFSEYEREINRYYEFA